MRNLLEKLIATLWNRLRSRSANKGAQQAGVDLGIQLSDGEPTGRHLVLSESRRTTHVAILGKTGTGKSSLLRWIALCDVACDRGFVNFDLHGDTTPFLINTISDRERKLRRHLSDKVVLIDLTDPTVSVGLNPLEMDTPDFVRIAEVVEVLKRRWNLDHFGARTEELLRNALYVLAANHLTLVELGLLLTDGGFRRATMKDVANAEVRQYFEKRFAPMSEPMKAVMREPILNKLTWLTSDPRFRHLIGQARSTFSIREAMDQGQWVIVNLPKGRLGEQVGTAASLIFTMCKNAIFARERRSLFSLFCDEIQNLVAYGSEIEMLLSESRKFGVGVLAANQFLDQYPTEMRAAILSVGTQAFFQLTSTDAAQVAQALDGGKPLAERLKNLPQRHAIVKSGSDPWQEIKAPFVRESKVDSTDLINRVRYTRGTLRTKIEADIAARQSAFSKTTEEALDDWD